RLDECPSKLKELAGTAEASGTPSDLVQNFDDALSNDFNLSAGWAAVFDWVRQTNKLIAEEKLSASEAARLLADWARVDAVLAVSPQKKEEEIPAEILALLEERQAARKAKNFARSDAIRDELKSKGWVIEDTPKGPRLKRI
ncbi:MAG: hypothetical protein PHI67_09225, partial [Candidatus Methanomethylophilaceae archaeon]|nr:hypothetical protein [Candidatus Methanomethylophilaceae archaeon]